MPLKGPVRARDLRANIREWGFEQGVVITLEHMLDEFAGMRQHLRELTDLTGQCIDKIEMFISLGEGMKAQIETIRRAGDQHDASDVPPSDQERH